MSARTVDPDRGWDGLVQHAAAPHLLQSAGWGAIKSRWGWSATHLVWDGDGGAQAAPLATALVLTRGIARTPFVVGYVPKGPLLADPDDVGAWARVLADLEAWARGAGLTMLKIDPDVPASAAGVADLWSRRGWRRSSTQVQFPNTMVSDLAVGEEALLAGMGSKTRYNIRLAGRRGVTVRCGDEADLDVFYALYAATARRAGFAIRAADYYQDVWATFLASDQATVVLAEKDGVSLAGVIPVTFGRAAWYLYGASADSGREHMPAYLAQWESMRWATARGCARYDWWGGPTRLDEGDPLWGVYRFKRGFGAQWVEQLGAWDYPCSRPRYAALSWLERLRRGIRLASSGAGFRGVVGR